MDEVTGREVLARFCCVWPQNQSYRHYGTGGIWPRATAMPICPIAFFTKPFDDKKISQLSAMPRICINPLTKNDPASEILARKK